jgi:hypothetical protein
MALGYGRERAGRNDEGKGSPRKVARVARFEVTFQSCTSPILEAHVIARYLPPSRLPCLPPLPSISLPLVMETTYKTDHRTDCLVSSRMLAFFALPCYSVGSNLFRIALSLCTIRSLTHTLSFSTLQRGRRAAPSRSAPPSRSAARPASRPASTMARAPPQQSSVAAPAKSGGMLSGIGSTIAQGMAFGTGSAIAHQAVGAVMGGMGGGGRSEEPQQAPEYAASGASQPMQQQAIGGQCGQDKEMFYECLNHNKGDQQACHFLYEQLQQCQQSSSTMQFS